MKVTELERKGGTRRGKAAGGEVYVFSKRVYD